MRWNPVVIFILVVLGFSHAVFAIAAPAAQAPGNVKEHSSPGEAQSEIAAAIVQDLYARLARYTRGTGGELRFRLDDFRTLTGERARQARLLDLFTPPEGRLVDVDIERTAHGKDLRAAYRAGWSNDEAPRWAGTEEGRTHQDATVADAIRALILTDPELGEISAVTTYRVTVRLAGKVRTYRAAVFWIRLPDNGSKPLIGEAKFLVQDQITVGLTDVATESALPAGDPAVPRARGLNPTGVLKTGPVCAVTSQTYNLPTLDQRTNYSYRPYFSAYINCSCDSACTSGCTPVVTQASCTHGNCRQTTTNLAIKDAFQYAYGTPTGAECALGWACAGIKCTKYLFFCSCATVKVTVSISTKIGTVEPKLQVDYTISPTSAWSIKRDSVIGCPPCFAQGGTDPGIQMQVYSGGGSGYLPEDYACGDLICDSAAGESITTCPTDCDCEGICRTNRQECMNTQCPGMITCDACELEYQDCLNYCWNQ